MSLLSPQLQAFVSIAEIGSVHGAAAVIHLTQTAVTQRIKNLERQLGTSLFVRTRRGMQLTPEGEALLRYCNAAQELEGETLAHISGSAIRSEVEIGISGPSTLMRARVIPQCLPVLKAFPGLRIHFAINDNEETDTLLRSGKCQFAILSPEQVTREMSSKALKVEQYILVCSAKWKKRPLTDIIAQERIIDFNPADQITFNYLKEYDLFKLAKHERHYVNRIESLALMLSEEIGYSVLTKEFSQPYLDNKQLIALNNGKVYNNILALAWYARPQPPSYFSRLIEAIS